MAEGVAVESVVAVQQTSWAGRPACVLSAFSGSRSQELQGVDTAHSEALEVAGLQRPGWARMLELVGAALAWFVAVGLVV